MKPVKNKSLTGAGFFARILAALLIVNIATIGILVFVTYTQNTESVTKRTQENVYQQVSILAEKFDEQYRNALERVLRTLIDSPTLNDYLLGSEAEQLVIARRIEREYLRYLSDYPFIHSISFIDDTYNVAISAKNGVRQSGRIDLSDLSKAEVPNEWHKVLELYEKLKSTPVLLFSGNMEWFMPPREPQVMGPFTNAEGKTSAAVGQSKLDASTGTFGGVVIIEFRLDQWFEELKTVEFFNESTVWLFSQEHRALIKPEGVSEDFDPRGLMSDQVTSDIKLFESGQGLIAYTDLPLGPKSKFVRLAASIPTALLLLDLKPVIDFFTAVFVGSILLLTLISYSVSRYLAHPVAALQTTENRLANAQRIARVGNWEWKINDAELTISEQAQVILDYNDSLGRLSFKQFIECAHPDERKSLSDVIEEVVKSRRGGRIEHRVRHRDGSEIPVFQDIELERDGEARVVGTIQDISLRKTTEEKIKKLAYYDSTTGLANRTRLTQLAKEAIESAQSRGRVVGILFLDLDHFKRINDTFGHDVGDELLQQVANRLRHCVRLSDTVGGVPEFERSEKTVARLGGDEFVLLLAGLAKAGDVEIVAERVKKHLTKKFSVAGKDVFISGSVGISIFPDNGETVADLLRHADAAMYHAKNNGRNRFEYFTSSIERDIQQRLSIETRLHKAIERKEFILHYQPRVDIETNRIVAVEALIRWIDPDEGMIRPDQFIPVAEETGLIIPIGEWVLLESCQQMKKWRDVLGIPINMSVNLSPVQFNAPNLLDTLQGAIQESAIEPDSIELELTENALFENINASVNVANEFKALGVRLAIDDFGTGYSSLKQLKRFPVDIIKIDRSFIRDILKSADDALIVKTAISLGHNLRLRVVAEGVETEDQLAFLKEHQCDEVQGYFFGKPQPAREIGDLLMQEARKRSESDKDSHNSRCA